MKRHLLAILCFACLAMAILLSNLFLTLPAAQAQGKPPASTKVVYTFHLLAHHTQRETSTGSRGATSKIPYQDSPCLGIAMTINPKPNAVQVIMGISNQCGLTVDTVEWDFTSTAICAGQAYNGPADNGSVAQIKNGVFLNVVNGIWSSECFVNGVPVAHTLSFTGTAEGAFAPPNHGTASGRIDEPPITIP